MAIVRPEVLCQWKIPMTLSGIEPVTYTELYWKYSLNAHSWGFIVFMFITKSYEHTVQITCASVHRIKQADNGPIMMNQMQIAHFHYVATAKYQFYCCMLTACCIHIKTGANLHTVTSQKAQVFVSTAVTSWHLAQYITCYFAKEGQH